jgi:hypothetical protein
MKTRFAVRSLTTLATGAVIISLVSVSGAGQGAAGARPWTPARTADGQPDVQGYWVAANQGTFDLADPKTGGGRLDEILQGRNGTKPPPKPSRIVDPPNGQIPYQPWAAAKKKNIADHIDDPTLPEHVDTQARCLPGGVPRPMFFGQYRIVQAPGYVFILHEGYHNYRVIPLDGRPHVGPHTKLWMGDSRGHWEGNTLVVDVTNLNAKARLDMIGDFASDAVHVVERFEFVDAATFNYEVTIEDPTVYTRPWKLAAKMVHARQQKYEMWEDACHEGEQSADKLILRTGDAAADRAKP